MQSRSHNTNRFRKDSPKAAKTTGESDWKTVLTEFQRISLQMTYELQWEQDIWRNLSDTTLHKWSESMLPGRDKPTSRVS